MIFKGIDSIEELKSFLESNTNKYFVIENTEKNLKWIFDYDEIWCGFKVSNRYYIDIYYKLMYPLSAYPDYTGIFKDNKFEIRVGEIIRLATEQEIKMFNNIYEIWSNPKSTENAISGLFEKFDVKSELELKAVIVKKIMDSKDIINTLKEILDE